VVVKARRTRKEEEGGGRRRKEEEGGGRRRKEDCVEDGNELACVRVCVARVREREGRGEQRRMKRRIE
jgi:hypothetical protein